MALITIRVKMGENQEKILYVSDKWHERIRGAIDGVYLEDMPVDTRNQYLRKIVAGLRASEESQDVLSADSPEGFLLTIGEGIPCVIKSEINSEIHRAIGMEISLSLKNLNTNTKRASKISLDIDAIHPDDQVEIVAESSKVKKRKPQRKTRSAVKKEERELEGHLPSLELMLDLFGSPDKPSPEVSVTPAIAPVEELEKKRIEDPLEIIPKIKPPEGVKIPSHLGKAAADIRKEYFANRKDILTQRERLVTVIPGSGQELDRRIAEWDGRIRDALSASVLKQLEWIKKEREELPRMKESGERAMAPAEQKRFAKIRENILDDFNKKYPSNKITSSAPKQGWAEAWVRSVKSTVGLEERGLESLWYQLGKAHKNKPFFPVKLGEEFKDFQDFFNQEYPKHSEWPLKKAYEARVNALAQLESGLSDAWLQIIKDEPVQKVIDEMERYEQQLKDQYEDEQRSKERQAESERQNEEEKMALEQEIESFKVLAREKEAELDALAQKVRELEVEVKKQPQLSLQEDFFNALPEGKQLYADFLSVRAAASRGGIDWQVGKHKIQAIEKEIRRGNKEWRASLEKVIVFDLDQMQRHAKRLELMLATAKKALLLADVYRETAVICESIQVFIGYLSKVRAKFSEVSEREVLETLGKIAITAVESLREARGLHAEILAGTVESGKRKWAIVQSVVPRVDQLRQQVRTHVLKQELFETLQAVLTDVPYWSKQVSGLRGPEVPYQGKNFTVSDGIGEMMKLLNEGQVKDAKSGLDRPLSSAEQLQMMKDLAKLRLNKKGVVMGEKPFYRKQSVQDFYKLVAGLDLNNPEQLASAVATAKEKAKIWKLPEKTSKRKTNFSLRLHGQPPADSKEKEGIRLQQVPRKKER